MKFVTVPTLSYLNLGSGTARTMLQIHIAVSTCVGTCHLQQCTHAIKSEVSTTELEAEVLF